MTKLEAANRQLAMAVLLFLNDCDPVSVHTLVCAAREIFEKHLNLRGDDWMFDLVKATMPEREDKEIWNMVNRARNFFKHPGEALDDEIEFTDEDNDVQFIFAIHDSTELSGGEPIPEVVAMGLWFQLTEAATPEQEADPLISFFLRDMDAQYPGLRGASRAERKRFGRRLFSDGCGIEGVGSV